MKKTAQDAAAGISPLTEPSEALGRVGGLERAADRDRLDVVGGGGFPSVVSPPPSPISRWVLALSLGAAVGIFAFTGAAGLSGSLVTALAAGVLLAALAAVVVWQRPPIALAEATRSRGLVLVSLLATALALVQLGRLSSFVVNPSRVGSSAIPSSDFVTRHSCLSAYFVAAQAASTSSNIYDEDFYVLRKASADLPGKPRMLGSFSVDVFEYPPPFLLLPRALTVVVPEFLRLRMMWFALEGGVLLLAFLVVARTLGREAGARAFLLSPLIWAALPTATTLQFGNAQPLMIALAMMAMVLFERRHHAAGGLLLAYVTLSKLFPGLLIAYLIVRRQWRAVAWTVASGIALVLVTVPVIGARPFAAFLEHLPRLLSGESFPGLRRPAGIGINDSLPGLVFKLRVLGVPGMSFPAAKVVGWIATLLALGVAISIGRRPLQDGEKPAAWLAILLVATLRSPFLPQDYAVFPPLWLLTVMAAGAVTATGVGPSPRTLMGLVLAWLGLNILVPVDATIGPAARMAISAVPQAIVFALAVIAWRRVGTGYGAVVKSDVA